MLNSIEILEFVIELEVKVGTLLPILHDLKVCSRFSIMFNEIHSCDGS